MPAKNKKQQKLFGMALAYERGKLKKGASKKVKKLSKDMTEEQLEDFAKTKGLKENRAMLFNEFINEAHVTPEGGLEDFNFELDPHDEYVAKSYEHVESIKDFLEDSGASDVRAKLVEGLLEFVFTYNYERYRLELDMDRDLAVLSYDDPENRYPIFDGKADALFDLLMSSGLDFLQGL
jgi:hypothetical protein